MKDMEERMWEEWREEGSKGKGKMVSFGEGGERKGRVCGFEKETEEFDWQC